MVELQRSDGMSNCGLLALDARNMAVTAHWSGCTNNEINRRPARWMLAVLAMGVVGLMAGCGGGGDGSSGSPAGVTAPPASTPTPAPTPTPTPTPTVSLPQIATIDIGDMSACAVGTDGTAWCWGPNDLGQLGTGDAVQGNAPRRAAEGHTFKKVSIATGGAHSCGITTAGRAYCWGNQEGGRLGDGIVGSSGQYVTTPVPVSGDRTYIDIAAGGDHVCAVAADGAAYCWGHNSRGQCGTGNQVESTVPVAVTGGLTFTSITTHQLVTCGIATGGSAYCWGDGSASNLGTGSTASSNVPVAVKGGLKFASLQLGLWTACGVTTAGAGYCWGLNGSGELGIGSKTPEATAEPALVSGGLTWKSISPGVATTCGVTTEGRGYCWGGNAWGERGDGTFPAADVTSPVPVAGDLIFDSIDIDWATCGVAGGLAYCWGLGAEGSIGDGTWEDRGVPTKVAGQP